MRLLLLLLMGCLTLPQQQLQRQLRMRASHSQEQQHRSPGCPTPVLLLPAAVTAQAQQHCWGWSSCASLPSALNPSLLCLNRQPTLAVGCTPLLPRLGHCCQGCVAPSWDLLNPRHQALHHMQRSRGSCQGFGSSHAAAAASPLHLLSYRYRRARLRRCRLLSKVLPRLHLSYCCCHDPPHLMR